MLYKPDKLQYSMLSQLRMYLALSLTLDMGVLFSGGEGGRASPHSPLSLLPSSDAVLYSSSDENRRDLWGVDITIESTESLK